MGRENWDPWNLGHGAQAAEKVRYLLRLPDECRLPTPHGGELVRVFFKTYRELAKQELRPDAQNHGGIYGRRVFVFTRTGGLFSRAEPVRGAVTIRDYLRAESVQRANVRMLVYIERIHAPDPELEPSRWELGPDGKPVGPLYNVYVYDPS